MITMKRARELRKIIEANVMAANYTEAQSVKCLELYPEWTATGTYTVGTKCRYDGKLYNCVQAHTAQADWIPETAVSLWSEIVIDVATGYVVWRQPTGAHNSYAIGDRVVFENKVYESKIAANTYSPTAYPAGWTEV